MILLDNMSNYDRLIGSISRMDSSPLPFEDHPGFYWQGEHSRSADVAVGRTSSHRLPIVGATTGVDYVEIITDYSNSTARDLLKGLGVKDPAEAEIKITTEGDDGRLAGVISFRERQVVASFDVGTFAVKRRNEKATRGVLKIPRKRIVTKKQDTVFCSLRSFI